MHDLLPKPFPEWIIAGLMVGVIAGGISIFAEEITNYLRGKFKKPYGK
jgi:hypothetical protein